MTTQHQHRALMGWMGWTDITDDGMFGVPPRRSLITATPSLTLDLLHEAEKQLTDSQQKRYAQLLCISTSFTDGMESIFDIAHAPVEKKLEDILRATNLWIE